MEVVPPTVVQVLVSIIPIVGIVMGSTVIFFYLYWNHQQRMLMIEKNMLKRKDFDIDSFSIFSGLMLFGVGISLVIFFLIKDGFSYGVLSGLIPLSIGVCLIIFFVLRITLLKNSNET